MFANYSQAQREIQMEMLSVPGLNMVLLPLWQKLQNSVSIFFKGKNCTQNLLTQKLNALFPEVINEYRVHLCLINATDAINSGAKFMPELNVPKHSIYRCSQDSSTLRLGGEGVQPWPLGGSSGQVGWGTKIGCVEQCS